MLEWVRTRMYHWFMTLRVVFSFSFPSQWSLRNQTENQLCGMLRMFRRHRIPFRSLTLSLPLRFWHWTSPHIHSAVCVIIISTKASIDFPFHFIRYLFYLHGYHYFVVTHIILSDGVCCRCVVAWSWFHALWLFSFNWNSRHFHASKKKNYWQIYSSSNFFGLISCYWEEI